MATTSVRSLATVIGAIPIDSSRASTGAQAPDLVCRRQDGLKIPPLVVRIHAAPRLGNCLACRSIGRRSEHPCSDGVKFDLSGDFIETASPLDMSLAVDVEYVFPSIVLTRNGAGARETRTGAGTVQRKGDGSLMLRMFAAERVSFAQALAARGNAGELLPDDAYFSMAAIASNGDEWHAERITINDTIHGAVDGSDVRASLAFMSSRRAPFVPRASHDLELVVHTSGSIPANAFENSGTSSSNTQLNVDAPDGSKVSIFQREGHVLVKATNAASAVDPVALARVLEGLAIATGAQMTISCERTRSSTEETTRLVALPIAESRKTIWSPFDRSQRASSIVFVGRYARFAYETDCPFFDSWLSIVPAWDQGLVAASLPLAVGVERMLRALFSELMKETLEVRTAAEAMAKHLESAPVDDAMKRRGKGAIQQIKGKSPSSALKALAQEGWFDVGLEGAWRAVRNPTAHGGTLIAGESQTEVQEGLDNMLRCLHLFYVLLMVSLKFEGPFVDHSVRGFPDLILPPLRANPEPTPYLAASAESPAAPVVSASAPEA